MPKIIPSVYLENDTERKALIDELTKKAKEVFCPLTGILKLPKGSTEIIPDFRDVCHPVAGPRITILLHKKDERTVEMLKKIKESFAEIKISTDPFRFFVAVNDQPEKFWIKV